MGFGLLFIGYFLTMINSPIFGLFGTLIRVGGCALLLCAAVKLGKYNKAFNLTLVGAVLMTAMSAVLLAINIDGFLYSNLITPDKLFSDLAKTVIGYTEQGVSFVFNSFLLWGILKISKETEAKKITVAAIRNYIFVCAYYLMYVISFLPFSGIQSAQSEFAVITWILYFVWIGLNLFLLFNCYATICDEDDLEMERKPSKFAFVNKFRDEFERKSQKAREADALYRQEKRQKREDKRKGRRKK